MEHLIARIPRVLLWSILLLSVPPSSIWDNRMPSYFFRIFGRPVRASVCECERSNEPSISQALHLMNSQEVMEKILHQPVNAFIDDNIIC